MQNIRVFTMPLPPQRPEAPYLHRKEHTAERRTERDADAARARRRQQLAFSRFRLAVLGEQRTPVRSGGGKGAAESVKSHAHAERRF